MARKKINTSLIVRLSLTAIFTAMFCVVFFVFGGTNFLLGRIGQVNCFAGAEFEVHFIDVGQGDSSFVRFPDGKTMLIDAGTTASGDGLVTYLKDLFKQEQIGAIDYFVLTHSDSDHVGGAVKIFDNFQVNNLYRPTVYCDFEKETLSNLGYGFCDDENYSKAIIAGYREKDCTMEFSLAGKSFGEGYEVEFLAPNDTSYSSDNDYSPIMKITYGQRSFLFTGDADFSGEREAIDNFYLELDCDVLKVGHHGSKYSTSMEFLYAVTPEIAVISVGAKNSYGHPAPETLKRLQDIGAQVFTTADSGSIAMSVDKDNNIWRGGSNNQPQIDLVIVIVVYFGSILLVWGIKIPRAHKSKKQISTKKK